jgi:hypothetical protein
MVGQRGRDFPSLPPGAGRVRGDAKQPGAEAALAPKLREGPPGAEIDVLYEVVEIRPPATEAPQESANPRLGQRNEFTEAFPVPQAAPRDKFLGPGAERRVLFGRVRVARDLGSSHHQGIRPERPADIPAVEKYPVSIALFPGLRNMAAVSESDQSYAIEPGGIHSTDLRGVASG